MGAYKAAIVTQGGQNLIAQALAGDKTLAFTSAKTSEHIYPVGTNITALTGLQDIMQSAQISSSKVLNDTAVQVSVRFDNDGVTQQYRINTIGVYAQPEEGQEILFAVIQAVTPDEMPVQSEVSPSAFIYNIQFAVRNASQITLLVNPAGVATLQDILDVRQEIIDIEIPEFEDYSSEGVKVPDAREAIANIKSKTKLKVILSNVKAALMGLVTLGEMRGLLVNHGLCTEPGKFFLDAAYGKTLTDMVTQLNSDFSTTKAISLTPNPDWIKSDAGKVLCFKIADRYIFQFTEVIFLKDGHVDFADTVLWTLGENTSSGHVFVLRPISDKTDNYFHTVRLYCYNDKIYGHYSNIYKDIEYFGLLVI
jgi:hypothetical protein